MDRGLAPSLNDDLDLIANANAVAEVIDSRHGFGSGIIRQLARRVAELAPSVEGRPGEGCSNSGAPVVQPATGRRRIYCPRPPCQAASRRGRRPFADVSVARPADVSRRNSGLR